MKVTAGIHFFEVQGLHFGSLYIMSTFSRERFDDSYKKKKTDFRESAKISFSTFRKIVLEKASPMIAPAKLHPAKTNPYE